MKKYDNFETLQMLAHILLSNIFPLPRMKEKGILAIKKSIALNCYNVIDILLLMYGMEKSSCVFSFTSPTLC